MNASQGTDPAKALRRRHRHERQAALFGILIAGLAIAALGGFAIFTDAIPSPFTRDFTTAKPDADATVSPAPCPPAGTMPVVYQNVKVNVLNATKRGGLATTIAASLTGRGFTIASTGNSAPVAAGVAQIKFGASGVGAAYTLAAQLDGETLVLDTRKDATVDLIIGPDFAKLIDPGAVVLDPAVELVGTPTCVALADVVPEQRPTAAATDAPTAAAG